MKTLPGDGAWAFTLNADMFSHRKSGCTAELYLTKQQILIGKSTAVTKRSYFGVSTALSLIAPSINPVAIDISAVGYGSTRLLGVRREFVSSTRLVLRLFINAQCLVVIDAQLGAKCSTLPRAINAPACHLMKKGYSVS